MTEEQDKQYDEIMHLYDLAEEVIDVVEFGDLDDPESYVELVEQLVGQLEVSAETLSKAYVKLVESEKKPSPEEKKEIEKALRAIFLAVENFKKAEDTLS